MMHSGELTLYNEDLIQNNVMYCMESLTEQKYLYDTHRGTYFMPAVVKSELILSL